MASLLDSLNGLVTSDTVNQLAGTLGESDVAVTRGLQTGMSSVLAALAGLASRPDDTGRLRQAFEIAATQDTALGTARGTDFGALVRGLTPGAMTAGPVGAMLAAAFGGRTNEVGDIVARSAGITRPSSRSPILAVAGTLVLGYLARRIREENLSLAALSQLLVAERTSLRAAAPAGLLGLLDAGPASPRVDWADVRSRAAAPPAPVERPNRWFWPVAGAVAVLGLFWALLNREPERVAVGNVADTTLAVGERMIDTAAGTIADAARDLGAFARRSLPGGKTLDVPERGIESRLTAFIGDPTRAVNDTTWFEFDRLNFATGSAPILPQSQEQLDNIAAVLTAYPAVKVKIGGYTDNVGDPASNLRLSDERARSVASALVAKGIAATRLTTQGYGEQHPVADNATEEGRAHNRRIALRVTEK